MSNLKVVIPRGMLSEEADDILYKAIKSKINGSSSEKFSDVATEKIANDLIKYHEEMYSELMDEVIKIIEE